mgnify:CR=1 FL=1
MNYASAYRTNNYIVSTVENLEGNVDWNTVKLDVKNKYSYNGEIGYCCNINSLSGTVYQVKTYINAYDNKDVTFTALATASTPLRSCSRASLLNIISFAILFFSYFY